VLFRSKWSSEQICSLLERVDLPEPGRVLRSYPHELSGGMLQRVAIAIAVATEPAVLIADEPTSALDAPLKWQIVDLLQKLHDEGHGTSLIVTHDPGLVDAIADRLIVLFGGQIVEHTVRNAEPHHPYTRQLLGKEMVKSLDASIPRTSGCVFAHRCPRAADRCSAERPELERAESDTWVRCFYWK
jgi:oligopeptide/dipeptide ABC transporter ATP-binding protein